MTKDIMVSIEESQIDEAREVIEQALCEAGILLHDIKTF